MRQRPVLLLGSPGVGKTAIMEQIASELGIALVNYSMTHHTRQSALGLPFIVHKEYDGRQTDITEYTMSEIIASIYETLEESGIKEGILFLDEIDGMLQSRERAQRSWEVTHVNELLHQMENFNGVMIGATNFSVNLDPAVLRRFTFKLEFDYLDENGKKLFFERMFQTKLSTVEERKLAAVPRLAPGDFRTVRQSFFYLGGSVSNDDRIDALRRESESKQDMRVPEDKKIGF